MDSGIIPVSSRNGSPAGSSGLLGIPRENSVSGVDLTCDGGSILNGKKLKISFHHRVNPIIEIRYGSD